MNETSNTNVCERGEDLVGFLYGELSDLETRRFERHMNECAACQAEVLSFGQIRRSIVEWRDEALGMTGVSAILAEEFAGEPAKRPARSAMAALREFFALSPAWLQGATAFAGVAFCICAVFTVFYLKSQRPVVQVSTGITQQQLDTQVAAAVAKTRAEMASAIVRTSDPNPAGPQDQIKKDSPPSKPRRANEAVASQARRPFTERERQELAADLRLVGSQDDDDLDLTGDANRPNPQ